MTVGAGLFTVLTWGSVALVVVVFAYVLAIALRGLRA